MLTALSWLVIAGLAAGMALGWYGLLRLDLYLEDHVLQRHPTFFVRFERAAVGMFRRQWGDR